MEVNSVCCCGCGELIQPKRWHKYTNPRYLPGHQGRNSAPDRRNKARYQPTPEEIPSGICECGCGGITGIAKATYRHRRHFKGYPLPYLPTHGPRVAGADLPQWRGGRSRTSAGYILVRAPDHPDADRYGYIREHRYVMEQHLGRRLLRTEFVHHINGVKDDNRLENLVVMTKAEHNSHHAPERVYDSAKMSAAGKKGAAARWGPTSERM